MSFLPVCCCDWSSCRALPTYPRCRPYRRPSLTQSYRSRSLSNTNVSVKKYLVDVDQLGRQTALCWSQQYSSSSTLLLTLRSLVFRALAHSACLVVPLILFFKIYIQLLFFKCQECVCVCVCAFIKISKNEELKYMRIRISISFYCCCCC